MPIFGSDGGFQADNRGGVIDELGNTIVSSDTQFASSPLGVAARTQALYGIPNANFNLTPADPDSPIVANQNDLPYWSIEELSDGVMTATSVFDSTTQTWGVQLNPGTAASGASLSLSTRSYLITDDNLALRQKALAVLSKSGTAGGTASQWNLTLSAIYYDSTDSALSTAFIGTALDTGTWTSFSGTTTPGGSAISAAAQYVDLTFTLTTTAAVTGSVTATIKSLLLNTSSAANGSFLIAQTFTANDTWTRPLGVEYLLAAVAAGGGGGGGGGQIMAENLTSRSFRGASGGAGGNWWIIKDLYVGDQSTISIGIGAGGAGGTAQTFSKASGDSGTANIGGANGSNGGNTTIGSYVTVYGGGAGQGVTGGGATNPSGGTAGAAPTTGVWLGSAITAGTGGRGGAADPAGAGAAGGFSGYTLIPYSPASAAGSSGGAGTGTGATQTAGALGTPVAGWIGGGGGSGAGTASSSSAIGTSGSGNYGGGGGGASRAIYISTGTATVTGTAGNGGSGTNAGGGGGGGSLALATSTTGNYTTSTLTLASGAGGSGANGFVTLVYIA